jgi:hypothetical protein
MLINQIPTEQVEQANSEEELLTIENDYWVELKEALDRLENGQPQKGDFKKVILDGYFKDKAINGVSLLSTDYVKQNGLRSDVMEQLIAISALEDYFATIKNLGTMAPDDEEETEG